MSILTSGPFGPGSRQPKMASGDYMDPEPHDGAASGVLIDGAWWSLAGQPPAARAGSWGDMSWMQSPFYAGTGAGMVVEY